ncbi:flagellar basal body rod protein FlgB [Persephonella sp.]
MSEIFGHIDLLEEKASYFLERTKVIQSNIANADTPFYKPKDLIFEKVLREQVELKRTDPRHIDPNKEPEVKFKLIENGKLTGYDKNQVNVEEELAKLAESSIMYKTLLESMKKEMAKLKYAISGR